MDHVIPTSPCSNVFFFINDTSRVMNRVRSDTVIPCIGSRVQENVLQFGQIHQTSPCLGYIFGPLTILSA